MNFSIVLDAVVVLVLALSAVIGYKKGFLRYVLGFLGTIAVIIASFFAANIFTDFIYDNYVQQSVVDYIDGKISDISVSEMVSDEMKDAGYNVSLTDNQINELLKSDGDISKEISKEAEKAGKNIDSGKLEEQLNDFFENRFAGKLGSVFTNINMEKLSDSLDYSRNMSYDIVRALANGDTQLGAKYIEQSLVRPIILILVKIVLFIVFYLLLSIILKIVLKITGILNHIPIANGINKFFGLLAGLAKGLLYMALMAYVIGLVVDVSGDSLSKINTEIINKTTLFRYIFEYVCN
ncbi:MAG: hypothetical protein ACI4I7_04810 [Oscillospiraceae bacterium]